MLNHPDVSRLHAGIKEIDGRFYLINLSSSNSTTVNGRLVVLKRPQRSPAATKSNGPFFLRTERKDDALVLIVTLQFGLRIGEAEAREEKRLRDRSTENAAAAAPSQVAQALDLFWGKHTRKLDAGPHFIRAGRRDWERPA